MFKKISIVMVGLVLVFGIQFSKPQKTEAFLASGSAVFDVPNTLVNTAQQIFTKVVEESLKVAVKKIVDRKLRDLANKTINWANDPNAGFIDNWGDFLKGTVHEELSTAFGTAEQIAKNEIGQFQTTSQLLQAQCQVDVAAQFPSSESSKEACDERYGQYMNEFEGCIYQLDPVEDEDLYSACENVRDGQEYAYDICLDTINSYNAALQQKCNIKNQTSAQSAQIAQQNHQKLKNGNTRSAIDTLKTVAKAGYDQLNKDELNSLLRGEGTTLKRLLGSQEAVDDFSNDFSKGGILGYVALGDLNNHPSGRQSLIKSALGDRTSAKLSQTVQDVQTPNKFLNVSKCDDKGKDDDGNCIGRKTTTTPGGIVEDKLAKAFDYDSESAKSLGDSLVGSLIGALGQLTDGLLTVGINKATGAVTGALNNVISGEGSGSGNSIGNSAVQNIVGNNQSEYDVLGIVNDVSVSGVTGSDSSGGSNPSLTDVPGGEPTAANAEGLFVGGPEDKVSGDWYNNPRIIIDFKKDLEENLAYLQQEAEIRKETVDLALAGKESVVTLDRCIPGPDFNWENRLQDLYLRGQIPEEEKKKRLIAFSEMKKMAQESKVNVPGAGALAASLTNTLRLISQNETDGTVRLQQVQKNLFTLEAIKESVSATFNNIKNDLPSVTDASGETLGSKNLVLFNADWQQMSKEQQKEAFGFAISAPYNGYDLKQGETIDQILLERNDFARDIVFNVSWDLWREKASFQEKQDLRYSYYSVQNRLSSPDQVQIARAEKSQFARLLLGAQDYVVDCLVLKMYSSGYSETEIKNTFTTNGGSPEAVLVDLIDSINVRSRVSISGFAFWSSPTLEGNFVTPFEVPGYRSDAQIKSFLEREYAKQIDSSDQTISLFRTNKLTSPSAIKASILGFDSETEKNKFYELYYPEDKLSRVPDGIAKNPKSMRDIYFYDYFFSAIPAGNYGGLKGTLYCRFPETWEVFNRQVSMCLYGSYYHASDLEYERLFNGV